MQERQCQQNRWDIQWEMLLWISSGTSISGEESLSLLHIPIRGSWSVGSAVIMSTKEEYKGTQGAQKGLNKAQKLGNEY
eukprot:1155224-Pelagomonas_calceolata.AAC.2